MVGAVVADSGEGQPSVSATHTHTNTHTYTHACARSQTNLKIVIMRMQPTKTSSLKTNQTVEAFSCLCSFIQILTSVSGAINLHGGKAIH